MKLKRIIYKIINPLRILYWFIIRPKTSGVKCLIECDGKFLMIRNTYGRKNWTFPGGGVQSSESIEAAARREVQEEVGIDISKLKKLGEYTSTRQYKRDTVHCFFYQVKSADINIDPDEILEARWYSLEAIPSFQASAVEKVLNLYRNYSARQ